MKSASRPILVYFERFNSYRFQLGVGSLEMNQDIVELYVEGLNIDELTLISKESYPALS